VRKVILRAAAAETLEVTSDPATSLVEVSGVASGGAKGYHSGNPFWRETPAAEWGLDFVSARFGDVLVISTENEFEYIHHHYMLKSLEIKVPVGVDVVLEPRILTGDGAPDLKEPAP
jgi:hypothetical protein